MARRAGRQEKRGMSGEELTRAVLTQDGRVLIQQPDGSYRPARTDWARLRAQSDEEVEAAAASDPDASPLTRHSGARPASPPRPGPEATSRRADL